MRHRLLKITSFLLLLIITFSLLPNAIVFSSGAADRDATTAVADQKVYVTEIMARCPEPRWRRPMLLGLLLL